MDSNLEFPILFGIAVGYGCISYWMVGLEPEPWSFIFFLAVIFAVINVGFSVSQVRTLLSSLGPIWLDMDLSDHLFR